jgi:hypothetical protein
MKNLNLLSIRDHWNSQYIPLRDYSLTAPAQVDVIFRDLEDRLIEMISRADAIFGCVAWLTNKRILEALATKRNQISIVVQKEDFLRPDSGSRKNNWKSELHQMYRNLGETQRVSLPGIVSDLSFASDQACEAVRCVGNHNAEKSPACPRMHNKFLVFCTLEMIDEWEEAIDETDETTHYQYPRHNPYAVWTGSFNLTLNATNSLENAVVIHSAPIAQAYLDEWAQILALSEPLDWEQDWIEPTWRLGS